MREKDAKPVAVPGQQEPDGLFPLRRVGGDSLKPMRIAKGMLIFRP